ncbi:hypothetical protein SCHPADRAFT_749058 [Schizopora paradoxa]|uniref:Uncharacterized protein n=1 Tax=Schizopora paradoxa TaxID=27342 RepID=A0A0H2QYJ0_9AGAM|nr:hypothetical protein SCHPADRAFT_749058 [Schizopora paradoxa]
MILVMSYVVCLRTVAHVAWLWPVSHDLLSQVVSMKPPPVHGDPYLCSLWIPIAPQASVVPS